MYFMKLACPERKTLFATSNSIIDSVDTPHKKPVNLYGALYIFFN